MQKMPKSQMMADASTRHGGNKNKQKEVPPTGMQISTPRAKKYGAKIASRVYGLAFVFANDWEYGKLDSESSRSAQRVRQGHPGRCEQRQCPSIASI